ncbi:hypothetical protein [Ideonella sp.]|uniref:hypothetical protein n=1 Tax=Ideonella sp. TaxID=1929293 RepID=UPI002B483187|nr:hypothetical protein [Ideonella sp.]HJV67701.1 hypothetical protein [Ideonella sp.]
MKSPLLFASIATLAVIGGASSLAYADESHRDGANDRHDRAHTERRSHGGGMDHGMQAVPTSASPGEPAHGWRYFSDPAATRAVVISPQGEYYLSRGRGLRLVAVTQPGS